MRRSNHQRLGFMVCSTEKICSFRTGIFCAKLEHVGNKTKKISGQPVPTAT